MPRLTVMKLTSKTDKLLRAGRFLIVFAIVGLALSTIFASRKIKQVTANVRITNDRLHYAENVMMYSINNTSAVRGYALTSDTSFLNTVRKTAASLQAEIEKLAQVYKADTGVEKKIDTLRMHVSERIALSEKVVSARQTGGLEEAARFVNEPGKVRYLEHIQRIVGVIEGHERVHLKKYNESRDKFFALLNTLSIVTVVLIMIFASLVMWLAMRDLANRKEALALLENYNSTLQVEVEVQTSKRLQIFERITDAFVALDRNFCYTYVNKKAGEILNKDPKKIIGRDIWSLFPESKGSSFEAAYKRAMKDQKHAYLQEYFPLQDLWLETNIYPSPEGLSVFFRDITGRKNAEQKTERTTRLYNFISHLNKLIIYAKEEKGLFKEICDISIAVGEFEMSWIGLLSDDRQTLIPVAHAGDKNGYLQHISVTGALDAKNGKGTAATAVRENQSVVSNDIEKDPIMAPWKSFAAKSGFRSVISIPFTRNGKITGVFLLYTAQKNFFGSDEVFLLEEVAKNISHLLDRFENEIQKEKAAQELRESEAFSEKLIAASPDVIYIYDLVHNKNIYSNEGIMSILGYTKDDVKEMGDQVLSRLLHPDDFDYYLKHIFPQYSHLADKKVLTHEYRMKDKSGNWHWFLSKESVYLRDSTGKPMQIFGNATDITENKNREAVLIEKEHQLRLFVEYSPASIAMLDSNMRYMVVSKRWQIDNGMVGHDVTGMSHYEVVPNIPEKWREIHARCLGGAAEKSEEDMLVMPDGSIEWIKWEVMPWHKASGIVGGIIIFSEVITQRKRAEQEITKSKDRLERAEEHALMGSWEFDVVKQEISWSKQMFRFFGLPETGAVPSEKIYLDLIHPDDRVTIQKVMADMYAGKEDYEASVYRTNPERVQLRYLQPSWMVEKDENGNVIRLSGTIIDMTSQIEAENTILKEKKVSDRIINTLPGVFYLYNKDGKFLRWNEKFSAVTGYSDSEISQLHPLMLFTEKDKELLTRKISNVFAAGEDNVEADFVTKSGVTIPYYFTGVTIEYEGETCLMGVGIDISEATNAKRKTQELTVMMERAEAHAQMGSWEYDVVNQKGKWSQQTFRFFGLPYSETPPPFDDYMELIHEDDRPAMAKMLKDMRKGIIPQIPVYRTNPEKLPLRYLRPSWAAEKDENGKVIRIYGADIDVTEQILSSKIISTEKGLSDTVINSLPGVFNMFDSKGRPIRWNRNFETIMGYTPEELSRMHPNEFFPEADREKMGKNFADIFEKGGNEFEATFINRWGEHLPYYLVGRVVEYQGDLCMIGLGIDISEQKNAERLIKEEKELSDSVINNLPGAFNIFSQEGLHLRWNKNFETVTGYSHEELGRMYAMEFIDESEHEIIKEAIRKAFEEGSSITEASFKTKDGQMIPHLLHAWRIDYDGHPCMLGMGINIAERKRKEDEVREISEQLRSLMSHQQEVREEERKRIAREIHDELGQQLTAVKMDVAWIDKKTPEDNDVFKKKLKNIIGLLDSSNLSIRKILNELRMGILDHYNIVEALRIQGRQFSENTGVALTFDAEQPDIQTTEPMTICLYRVYQEALTNITRYAAAKKVKTRLWQDEKNIYLKITDDGKGFDEKLLKSGRSFGVLGMKERVAALKGSFELKTAPGKGTQITISLPFNTQAEK